MKDWYDENILDQCSYRERVEGALKWILLPRLKEYLKLPERLVNDRQDMRRELNEIIAKIDELQAEADIDR